MILRPISGALVALSLSLVLFAGCQEFQSGSTGVSMATTRPAADRMRATVTYLASDELEGRGVETEGINVAARYLAGRLKSAGLKPVPGATDGYFQPFNMRGETRIEPDTRLVIGDKTLELGKDFRPLNFSGSSEFKAGVAFVGYAARNPDHSYDDFAGIDVKGRVVLAMRYEPHNEAGKSRWAEQDWSEQASLVTKAENAAAAGAAAILLVNPPSHHGEQDQLVPFGRRFRNEPLSIPVIQVTRAVADDLLARAGASDLKALQESIDSSGKPASVLLSDSATVAGNINVLTKQLDVKNVVAALPGRGKLADEWIVVGAHYDHLGYGGRQSLTRGDAKEIHNGADDNASGTAAVLELAERLAKRPPAQRSVLFIFFSGEENGLLGSEHYVNHPLIPLQQTVAMVNLDMVGRIKNDDLLVGGRDTAAGFEDMVATLDEQSPLRVKPMTGMVFGSSDHASFMKKQIPVLFLFSGLHADYHRPSDDADKINYGGMALAVNLAEGMVRRIAEMPRQSYVARAPTTRASTTGPARDPNMETGRPQLGIIPSYSEEDASPDGIKVTGTTPGSAAADAGLKNGDILQAIDGKRMRTLEDLVEYLQSAKVGQKITMHLLREGKPMDVETTLKARQ